MAAEEVPHNVIVASVPHTGTRSLARILQCGTTHFIEPRWREHISGKIVYVPLRDPRRVFASWQNRQGTNSHRFPLSMFETAWRALEDADKEFDLSYVLMDKWVTLREGHVGGGIDIAPVPPWIMELPMVKAHYGA